MSDILILGTKKCDYCTRAKVLLEDEDIEYTYIDLASVHSDWKAVFNDSTVASLLGDRRRSIPLIFRRSDNGVKLPYAEGTWQFVGGYDELRKWVFSISNDDEAY